MQAQAQRRGVALVLVLAFLVLISVFVVGFFVSATSELQQSTGYAATTSTQQLSETATNIVIGQIREATTRPGEVWASQPGMVRTYRTKVPKSFYKLYSSNKMVIEGKAGGSGDIAASGFRPDTDVPVGSQSGWNHKPAIYVDLNDPVRVPLPNSDTGISGTLGKDYEYRYPIFDPASFFLRSSDTDPNVGNFQGVVASTAVAPDKRVEGAEIIKIPGDDSGATQLGADKKTAYSRMPVRWLYVLKDGTMTSPSRDLNGTVAQWDDSPDNKTGIPTANNPIVGRVAFWADDDTCKVNINTAGGFSTYKLSSNTNKNEDQYCGSYWDSPRFNTRFDAGVVDVNTGFVAPENMSLALAQPIRNEFQRYPGHPSTTSLGLVFKNMLSSAQIYALTPRLTGGMQKDSVGNPLSGSDGGTRRLIQAKGVGNEALTIKRERLYGSVDELLFAAPKKNDSLQSPRRLNTDEIGATGLNGITPDLVNRMRFFLTAHSRAPELNVFGRPRVTIWPLWPMYNTAGASTYSDYNALASTGAKTSQTEFRRRINNNPTEKLIAFCSTLGPKTDDLNVRPYFFQRSNPYSATEDGSLKRNQDLFRYLVGDKVGLFSLPILGAGGRDTDTPDNFKDKYPGEKEDGSDTGAGDYHQLVAEIFDYIRCVNLNDTSHDTPAPGNQTAVPGDSNYIGGKSDPTFKYSPHAYVTPTMTKENGQGVALLNGSPGFGRFPTISEAALVFYTAGYVVWDPMASDVPGAQTDPQSHFKDTRRRIRVVQDRKEYYDIYAAAHQIPNPALLSPPTLPATALNNQRTFPVKLGLIGGALDYDPNTGRLRPGERVIGTVMKAFLLFENFTPMQGYAAESGFDLTEEVQKRGLFFQHECTGLESFSVTSDHMPKNTVVGGNLNFPYPKNPTNTYTINRFWDSPWGQYGYLGGMEGFFQTLSHCFAPAPPTSVQKPSNPYYYPFQSTAPWALPTNDGTSTGFLVTDNGGQAFFPIGTPPPPRFSLPGLFVPKQDETFKFLGGTANVSISFAGTVTTKLQLHFPPSTDKKPNGTGGHWPVPTDNLWDTQSGGYWHEGGMAPGDGSARGAVPNPPLRADSQFSLAGRIDWSRRHNLGPQWTTIMGDDTANGGPYKPDNKNYASRQGQFLLPGDTIRSLIPHNPNSKRNDVSGVDATGAPINMGDPRTLALIGLKSSVQGKYFMPHPLYDSSIRMAQGLRTADSAPYIGGASGANARDRDPYNKGGINDKQFITKFGTMFNGLAYQLNNQTVTVDMPQNVKQVYRSDELLPDYDNGIGNTPDGGYCNKSDEGSNSWRTWYSIPKVWLYNLPYYTTNAEGGYNSYFSPNKQMPSAVQFGSLLAGRTKHWQTLCFCPNAIGNPHPGITRDPKDHYILDFFTMPVVEPYAISEPFSTAGKVNLNYGMAPFGYIRRSTAMRAILHPVRVVAVPNLDSGNYKGSGAPAQDRNFRFRVDRDETLKAFQSYFSGASTGSQEIFRTGSQICEMYLYPNMFLTETMAGTGAGAFKPELKDIGIDPPKFTPGDNAMKHFWEKCLLTGDNMREKPYNDIYPRITTKSNTYTVHMWVQALRKSSTAGLGKVAAAAAQLSWDENRDQVIAEYRGSTTIERYIDPEDRRFNPRDPETAAKSDSIDPDKVSMEPLYRFRVVESKRFNP